jgi:hypothetical protein
VLRLASLLWRIRRATVIETDLLQNQAEILHERRRTIETTTQAEQKAAQYIPSGSSATASQQNLYIHDPL